MSSAAGSLLVPGDDDRQGALFLELPEQVKGRLLDRERGSTPTTPLPVRGDYTAERLFLQAPRLYQACVRMLGGEMPVETIAWLLGVSDNTVRAVRERESGTIADFRAKIGKRRRRILDLSLDVIERRLPEASAKDAAIVHGIMDEKERLDSGSPTAIVGTITARPADEEYRALLVREGLLIDGAIDVAPATGLGGEERGQKGAPDRAAGEVAEDGDAEPPRDT